MLGLKSESTLNLYITSIYFAFSTMSGVGYGDIRPFTNLERVFSIFCMLVSTGLSAYLIGSLSSIFTKSNIISTQMKLKSLHINQFLLYHKIPHSFRSKILSYLECLIEYKKVEKLEENEVLDLLNSNLKDQVIAFLNGSIIKECRMFDKFDLSFLGDIIFCLERKLYAINDNVFDEGEMANKMYFIGKGSVILINYKK